MVIVPTMQIAWTLFGIISGMLYFEEYLDFTPLSAAMFCTGVLVSGRGRLLRWLLAASAEGNRGGKQDGWQGCWWRPAPAARPFDPHVSHQRLSPTSPPLPSPPFLRWSSWA